MENSLQVESESRDDTWRHSSGHKRMGSETILDLNDRDVVFGTRGAGGNSCFIAKLEERAGQYILLSKMEKMNCIQSLIEGWDGRFFLLNDKTGTYYRVRDSTPSSKLYTSVRRMMNYVVKKRESKNRKKKTLLPATVSLEEQELELDRIFLPLEQAAISTLVALSTPSPHRTAMKT